MTKTPDKSLQPAADLIPPLLEKKYLKTIANCHECTGTVESGDLDGDGEITVLDIDQILQRSTGQNANGPQAGSSAALDR